MTTTKSKLIVLSLIASTVSLSAQAKDGGAGALYVMIRKNAAHKSETRNQFSR